MSYVSHERTRSRSWHKVCPHQVWPRSENNCTRESGKGAVSTNLITIYPPFNFVKRGYNYIHDKAWNEVIHLFPHVNSCTVEVWEWISNFIPDFIMHVIHARLKLIHVSKKGPMRWIWQIWSQATLVWHTVIGIDTYNSGQRKTRIICKHLYAVLFWYSAALSNKKLLPISFQMNIP